MAVDERWRPLGTSERGIDRNVARKVANRVKMFTDLEYVNAETVQAVARGENISDTIATIAIKREMENELGNMGNPNAQGRSEDEVK